MSTQPAPSKQIAPYQQLKQLISSDEIKSRFREVLGQKSQGFLASVLNTVYLSDYLREADPNSIMTSALTAAALDLPVDPNLGLSYIIPYNVKGKKTARFQIGYKGYIQLALRSGQYESINVIEIYEGEVVKEDRLTGKVILNGKRNGDKVIGYVAYFRLLNGFEKYLYKGVSEVRAHAEKYSQSFNYASSPWKSDFDKMAKKTVLKELISKYGIMSIQMQTAIEKDNDAIQDDDTGRDLFEINPDNVIDGESHEPQSFNPVAFLIDNGISENEYAAKGLLDKYVPDDVKRDPALLLVWGKLYRGWRDTGAPADGAAANATDGVEPPSK
jgi:recombination protein RecT